MKFFVPFLMLVAFTCCGKNSGTSNNPPKPPAQAGPTDSAKNALLKLVSKVKGADMRVYNVRDDKGHTMDCLKIIPDPYQNGAFIGVYHYLNQQDNKFKANVAVSSDLKNWTWIRELGGSGDNGPCHQPTIFATPNKEFVIAWEEGPTATRKNHIRVSFFKNWNDLKTGTLLRDFETPNTLSTCAEGTPNIYNATLSNVDIGMHFYRDCDVDRQARASLVFNNGSFTWNAQPQPDLDAAFSGFFIGGNIGDRDGYANFGGYNFGLFEAQLNKNDWSAWRNYLYDYQTGKAVNAAIATDDGSTSFGNPSITITQINGRNAVLITQFIFSQGAGQGEAGELIYYNYF